jgi:hypothetical protein
MSIHHARKFSKCGRGSQSHRVFRLISGLATAAILAAGFVTLTPGLALAAGVVLVNEPFTGTTTSSSEWVLPGAPAGTNVACMTASTNGSQTPIPGCGSPADSSGSGALRLTADSGTEEGGVAYGLSVPSSDGIDAIFDSYQYGTDNGADGIGFFLAAANPSNPQPPTAIGQPGGALGYSADYGSGDPGMTYGYLGVGLDVYGNYATTGDQGSGCPILSWVTGGTHSSPKSGVTVRGPGNGTTGYCALTSTYSTATTEDLDGGGSGTRSASAVPVEVVINPSGSSVTVAATSTLTPHNFSSFTVSANSYQVEFIPIGSSSAQILNGTLPNASSFLPSGWYNGSGIPYQMTFGWVGSTGGDDDVHEVNLVQSGTISGTPPQLSATVTDNASGAPPHGSTMNYTVGVTNASGAGAESDAITATDTIPTGETPVNTGSGWSGGTGWSCSTAGQIVTCTDSGGLAAGAESSITIPVDVTAAGGSHLTDSVTASSNDANPASASDTVIVAQVATSFTAAANPTSTTYGDTVQLSASGLPSDAAGTVRFTSGGSTLCTTATVSAGSASCTTAVLGAATYPVTATYSGDPNYLGSTAATSFVINQAVSSFTASPSPSSTTYGNTVQLGATGLPSNAAGHVTFTSGGSTLCVTGTVSAGSASCTTAVLPPATYPVTATYSGDANYLGSTATTSFTITQASTSFTASANPTSTAYGNTVSLSVSGLPSGATGTVTFTSGGSTLCTAGAVSLGSAACSTAVLAASTYPVTATYSGDSNYQGSHATTSFTITPDPVLHLSTSGTPSGAAAGTTYPLTLVPSLGGSPAGTSYHDPVLIATLPSGETFAAAPTATGWSCALSGSSRVLTCTSTLAPITAGTPLATVTATVDISSSASGSLQTTASLVDSTDLATTASVTATVGVTAPPLLHVTTSGTPPGAAAGTTYSLTLDTSTGSSGGAAYNDPTLYATLPTGETFATAPSISGWSCALSGFGTVLTCNSTAAPILAGTALAAVTATVDISSSASGSLQTTAALADSADAATTVSTTATVSVTAPPVLHVATSGTPSGAAAGTTYGLTLVPSLGGSPSGPAYHDPILTATLPSGETFAAAPSVIGWSCALSSGDTVLTCISTAAPIPAGTSLADLTATVDIASSAAGSLQTSATLVDSADLATAGGATATVDVTATPGLHIATSGTPSSAASGTHYGLTLSPSLGSSPAGPAYNDPTLTATLPSGETFASAPTATGWSCALSGGSTVLTCTSTLGSIPAGTTLAPVTATVDIASSATGSLQTTTSLADSADLAAAANATATVDITPDPVLDISSSGTPPDAAAGSSYGLTLSSSLGAFPAGPAYYDPVLTATLPSGETFAAAPVATGWSCALSAGGTVLTCNSILAPIPAGTSLSAVTATVDVGSSASGSLQTTASLADSSDAATTASTTATVDVTATPVLDIATSGTPSGAAAGTSYSLTESASLAASPAGPAYGDPTLTVILPAGETFAGVPTPSGWSCGLSSDHTYLSCTSSAAPIAVGTALAGVTATVDIASSSSGTLVSDAYLADSADAATPVSTSASVDVTGPPVLDFSTSGTPAGAAAGTSYSLTLSSALGSAGGPAYNDPILTTTLPTGETFAAAPTVTGWSCALSGGGTVLTCTSTAAPIPAGTSFADLTATVDIVSSAAGSLQTSATLVDSADLATAGGATATVDVTATPVLHLATSGTPSSASSGTHYGLTLSPSMGGSPDGPAYNDPSLTATLPSGETFVSAPTATGWSCALSAGSTVLTCTSTLGSIPAGTTLAPVTATVDIAPSATGSLETAASLADSADLATAATATATVDVTPDPVLDISSSGTPGAASAGASYALTLSSSLGAAGGPAYNGPTLAATLPSGETYAAAPNSTGWSCSLSVGDTVLTCTSNLAPIAAGTALPDVTATVDIASTALGTLQTTASLADLADAAATATTTASVDATATAVLVVSTSGTPTTAPAGSVYTLNVDVALSPAGGPAYNEPTVTLVLPTGETFAAAPTISGWDCVLSAVSTTLTCTRVAATPIDPGTHLLSLSVQVQVSSGATGELITMVSAGDTVDGATLAVTAARVGIPVATPATGAMPRAASPWGLGVLLAIAGFLLILGEEVERRFRSSAGRG